MTASPRSPDHILTIAEHGADSGLYSLTFATEAGPISHVLDGAELEKLHAATSVALRTPTTAAPGAPCAVGHGEAPASDLTIACRSTSSRLLLCGQALLLLIGAALLLTTINQRIEIGNELMVAHWARLSSESLISGLFCARPGPAPTQVDRAEAAGGSA